MDINNKYIKAQIEYAMKIYAQKLKYGFTCVIIDGLEIYENDIINLETGKIYPRHNEKYEMEI